MGNNMFVIQGRNGNRKFELKVPPTTTLIELCTAIEKEIQVPVNCQRIIYNGRNLNDSSEDFSKDIQTLGLKPSCKILVLGKKPDEEDENYKVMKKWETQCDSATSQLSDFENELHDMEKGFAPPQLLKENLPKMEKKVMCLAEELMKVLISLDGLTFTESQKESRAKRKCLIDRIHVIHDKCDKLSFSIKQLRTDNKV